MSVIWTTQFPSDLNSEADIKQHKDRMARNDTGLVLPGGSVLRYVDLAPGYEVSLRAELSSAALRCAASCAGAHST